METEHNLKHIRGAVCLLKSYSKFTLSVSRKFVAMVGKVRYNNGMKTINVALFVSEFEDPYINELSKGAVRAAREMGYNLYTFPIRYMAGQDTTLLEYDRDYQNKVLLQFVENTGIDVALITLGSVGANLTDEERRKFLETLQIPVIVITHDMDGYTNVNVDNAAGLIEGIEHLIHRHGRKHLGYISGQLSNQNAELRLHTFEETMQRNGFTPEQYHVVEGDFSSSSESAARRMLEEFPEVDALVCGNDVIAYGAYHVLTERGRKIGEDVAVLGFDDSPYSRQIKPGLATVRVDSEQLGYESVKICPRVLEGEKPQIKVPTIFVPRKSCGCEEDVESVSKEELMSMLEREASINYTLMAVSRNITNSEEENDRIYSMILKSLCRIDLKSVYCYTFPQEISFHREDIWDKPGYVKLQAYYKKNGERAPRIHYQPMPIYTYPVKEQDIRRVKREEREIPFSDIFHNQFLSGQEPGVYVVTLLYAGEVQYGFLVWEVEPEYFCQISKMSYQVSNALKVNHLLSSRNQLVEQLEEVSRTDPLTRILNRRGYMEKLGQTVANAENAGKYAVVIYADMNNLKIVNDRYGHEEGDASLRAVATILKDTVTAFHEIGEVGRLGGDEFSAYLISRTVISEEEIRRQLKESTQNFNEKSDKPYRVTVSAGMCRFRCSWRVDVDAELDKADRMQYMDKKDKPLSVEKSK